MKMLIFPHHSFFFIIVSLQFLSIQGQTGPGTWGSWSSWTRERFCESGPGSCVGEDTQTSDKTCPAENCQPWSPWGPCTATTPTACSQIRSKVCTETCVEDAWGPWGSWSSCSHSCGGDKSRSRHCIKGDCPSGKSGCAGVSSETETCDHANKGILITAYNQAEIFIPSTQATFSLPDIPGSPRVWHTLTGTVLCGGVYPGTSTNCLELQQNGDGWTPYSSTLLESRLAHSQWDSPSGIILLGGYDNGDSTELVSATGTTSQFTLNDNISYACAINNGTEVVVTGGFGNRKRVSVYSMSGFMGNLPDLNVERQYHACARYQDLYGKHVFLVTGGFTGLENTKSTEIFTAGAIGWTTVGDLPRARNGLRATNVNNVIYVLGGDTEILKFNPAASNTWTGFAQMTKKAGSKLEVSTINCSLVHSYWPNTTTTTPSKTTPITTTTTPTKTITRTTTSTSCLNRGFLIAGGWIGPVLKSAEVFNPMTGLSCPVGDLTQARQDTPICNNIICGGYGSPNPDKHCDIFDGSSSFTRLPVTLIHRRDDHLCWGLQSGEVILLGGYDSRRTTERVSADGSSSSADFSLPYDTYFSCGIDLGDHFVVTGGQTYRDNVTQYSETGFDKPLANLNQGRQRHACSKFVDETGKTALLVTGGQGAGNSYLSSTEIYLESTSTWSFAASLPSGRYAISAATLDNFIFVFGGRNSSAYSNEILSYDTTSDSWDFEGNMLESRSFYGLSLLCEVSKVC